MATSSSTRAHPGLIRTATRLAPASLLVQVLSFGSSIALATRLGATTQTDAYYLALSIPGLAYGILIAALRLGVIPSLTTIGHGGPPDRFARSCDELMSATLVLATAFGALLALVSILSVPAITAGSAHLTSLTRQYIVELSPYTVTGALLGVLGAILAVRGKFVAATAVLAFEPVLKSLLVIIFARQLGAQALIIGNLIGNGLAVVTLWVLLRRDGVTLGLARFVSSPVVRGIFKLSVPLVISQSLLSINPLVDRATAASLGAGSVTVFELGVRLFSVPTSLLTGVFIAPLAATWAKRLAEDGESAVLESFGRIVVAVLVLIPPLIVLGFVLRHQLVDLIYRGGRYSTADVRRTGDVLGMLLLGLTPQILVVPLTTLFIVRHNTMFPMIVGVANFALNATLDLALREPLGVSGIALSTAVTLTVLCGVCVVGAQKLWGSLHLRRMLAPVALSLSSCATLAISAELLLRLVGSSGSRLHAAAAVLGIGLVGILIHGSLLVKARSSIVPALPIVDSLSVRFPVMVLRSRRT